MTDRYLPPTATEAESETLDLHDQQRTFNAGQVVGDRYQILALLGRGGMGEVWHAFDLKLRVEVALKALRSDIFKNERRRESLRQEVRAAREVVSPNVCRVFDLHEMEGLELVSMEFVDGQTLLEVMRERAPLDLQEAQDLTSQFLAGLEAIHQIGLVHRDIKPENIMLTRAGRVLVMDFGIARQEAEGSGTVSGTAAYMAPEQAAGQAVDARADIYSAGIVLAEMVNPTGLKDRESRASVWEAVRAEPITIPDSPWTAVIAKAVAKDRDHRYDSAADLTRALEDVTLRFVGADDLHPYPGLASFTEEDAEYFFGREAEVEHLWRRLDRPHLLAITGPSGAGKTSFLRTGIIPSATSDWSILRCAPGTNPFASLGQALAREMAGDVKAVEILASGHQPDALVTVVARWRNHHKNALLIVDQFEEIFTLCPIGVQQDFSNLLGRLAVEANTFVLLSLRDDFLLRCREHEALAPVFTDLTALIPPTGGALRRALVQPAAKCGYRFEENQLIENMISEVEDERGALPLLAFALSRLWEKRDRSTGLLTRQAYEDIGGVSGALAQHAEATVDRIGPDRIAQIREIFRNLVTAEGTRAVREWDDLLTIFEGGLRKEADGVLRGLIDARLLTSYEVREDENEPIRRVEIIHESLLAKWPRLVRWQTQDEEGAQIRDELRQASRSWDEHGRHDDRLWTGTAFREFQLWRERYPGGLTDTEEAFAAAVKTFAARRRNRRRVIAAVGLAVLLAVLAIVTGLWRHSALQARVAEAQRLLALGQLELERFPTAALAWARASLGIADTPEGRLFALKAIANGPVARIQQFDIDSAGAAHSAFFSPDGKWVAYIGYEHIKVDHRSGGQTKVVDTFPSNPDFSYLTFFPSFNAKNTRLSVWRRIPQRRSAEIRTYGVPDFALMDRIDKPLGEGFHDYWPTQRGFFRLNQTPRGTEVWRLPHGGDWELFDRFDGFSQYYFDPRGKWMVCRRGNDAYLHSLEQPDADPKRIGHLVTDDRRIRADPNLRWIASAQPKETSFSIWPLGSEARELPRKIHAAGLEIGTFANFSIDDQGHRIAIGGDLSGDRVAVVWDLNSPPGVDPMIFRIPDAEYMNGVTFDPSGHWLVTGNTVEAAFWSIPENPTQVFSGKSTRILDLAFTPDGSAVFVPNFDEQPQLLAVTADAKKTQIWDLPGSSMSEVAIDPAGHFAFMGAARSGVLQIPLDGSKAVRLEGFHKSTVHAVAHEPSRNLVAAAPYRGAKDEKVIRVVDLKDGSVKVLGPTDDAGDSFDGGISHLEFLSDGQLISGGRGGIRRWNIEDGSSELIYPDAIFRMDVSADSRTAVATLFPDMGIGPLVLVNLETGTSRLMPEFGSQNMSCEIGPHSEMVAAADVDGTIRVGKITGGEPHVLYGHAKAAEALSFSPDGRRLASGDGRGTVRVWTLPNPSEPAPQTLSIREFLTKLDVFTNMRVVRDNASTTGWSLEVGPFPGWETVPAW